MSFGLTAPLNLPTREYNIVGGNFPNLDWAIFNVFHSIDKCLRTQNNRNVKLSYIVDTLKEQNVWPQNQQSN